MTTSGTISMTMREVDRLRTIQSVVDGMLMPWQAAERLHLSRRHVERLTLRVRWLFTLLYAGGLRITEVSANTMGQLPARRGRVRSLVARGDRQG
jgi:site-specific recombinase XerD